MANGVSVQPQSQIKEGMGGVRDGLRKLWQVVFPEVERPNALTLETVEKSERGEDMHEFSSFEDFLKELHS